MARTQLTRSTSHTNLPCKIPGQIAFEIGLLSRTLYGMGEVRTGNFRTRMAWSPPCLRPLSTSADDKLAPKARLVKSSLWRSTKSSRTNPPCFSGLCIIHAPQPWLSAMQNTTSPRRLPLSVDHKSTTPKTGAWSRTRMLVITHEADPWPAQMNAQLCKGCPPSPD
jgi:hypothetical protein